ncbi:MAG: hypothetical protein DCC75_11665, partial [Proteobacteria bacterium]
PKSGLPRAYGLALGELNQDGLPDLVATFGAPEEGSGYVGVWYGKKLKG